MSEAAAAPPPASGSGRSVVSFIRRLFELFLLVCSTLAALIFFRSAQKTTEENADLEREVERLKRLQNGQTLGNCAVCLEQPLEVVLHPCSHLCLCAQCAPRVKECPLCRTEVRNRKKAYVS